MNLVHCGLTYQSCVIYLDDAIVFVKDFCTHAARLEYVFLKLTSQGAQATAHRLHPQAPRSASHQLVPTFVIHH